jgi:hypothetical protein
VLACRLADALFRVGDIMEAERVAADTVAVVTDPDLIVDLQWTLTECRATSLGAKRDTNRLRALLRGYGIRTP